MKRSQIVRRMIPTQKSLEKAKVKEKQAGGFEPARIIIQTTELRVYQPAPTTTKAFYRIKLMNHEIQTHILDLCSTA